MEKKKIQFNKQKNKMDLSIEKWKIIHPPLNILIVNST